MKRSRLSPMSKKRRASLAERERVRLEVFERDGGCMFTTYAKGHELPDGAGWCRGPLTPHHIRKASQGGAYTPENLTTLCAFHNGWVEDFPDLAHRMGLVLRRGEAA